jgi:outer membrane autotransporter protein
VRSASPVLAGILPARRIPRLAVAVALCAGSFGAYAQCSSSGFGAAALCSSRNPSNFDTDARAGTSPAAADTAQWSLFSGTDRLHLGTTANSDSTRPDSSAIGNPFQPRGDTPSGSMGIYSTWYQDDRTRQGWYADVRGQYAWSDNRAAPLSLAGTDGQSRVGIASAELGYAIPLGSTSGWTLQPQGQLIYLRNNNYNLLDTDFSNIETSKRAGWMSRIGIRVQPNWVQTSGWRFRPYAAANWWHDDQGDVVLVNQMTTRDLYPSNRYELKAGVNLDFKQGLGAWGDLGWQWNTQSSSQSYQAWTVRAGMKYAW